MWDTVYAHIHLSKMFLSTDYLYEKTDWTSYLGPLIWELHTILRIISRGVSGLINDSLWCLGPWMNHLPPVWWSNFRLRFLIVGWCVSFIWWRGIFSLNFCLNSCLAHYSSFTHHFPLNLIDSQIASYVKYFVLTFSTDVFLILSKWKTMTFVLFDIKGESPNS